MEDLHKAEIYQNTVEKGPKFKVNVSSNTSPFNYKIRPIIDKNKEEEKKTNTGNEDKFERFKKIHKLNLKKQEKNNYNFVANEEKIEIIKVY